MTTEGPLQKQSQLSPRGELTPVEAANYLMILDAIPYDPEFSDRGPESDNPNLTLDAALKRVERAEARGGLTSLRKAGGSVIAE
ncbi:MAG: hypothetical protein NVSMB62_28090 [Acidobacteriaceae bacterium]